MSGGAGLHGTGSSKMSENVRFEIPKEMRSMAEASFEQARKTFEKFLDGAKETAGSLAERNETIRAGAKDFSAKAVTYAETNVQSSLDYAEKLLHAKDLPEVMRLHAEYVQGQMRTLAEQASEMGQTVGRTAMEAARSKH
jgi:phasin